MQVLNNRVGWSERHSLMNGRLAISLVAIVFSGVAIVYDFYHPFPKSKIVRSVSRVIHLTRKRSTNSHKFLDQGLILYAF